MSTGEAVEPDEIYGPGDPRPTIRTEPTPVERPNYDAELGAAIGKLIGVVLFGDLRHKRRR